jgi:hypothetical protein
LILVAVAAVTLAGNLAAGATHRVPARFAGLQAQMNQLLARTPLFAVQPAPFAGALALPRPRPRQFFAVPGPGTCEIAGAGGCSLVPCTQFAAAAAAAVAITATVLSKDVAPATGRRRCLPASPRAIPVATAPLVAVRAVPGR